MPNVPFLPGVPALTSYATANVALLTADAVLQNVVAAQGWGIYYQGMPVIIPATAGMPLLSGSNLLSSFASVASLLGLPNLLPVVASTIDFDFDQEWAVADYPVEGGGFMTYDKVQMPFEVNVTLACGGPSAQRQAFLNSIFALAGASPLGSSSLLSTILSPITSAIGSALGSLASTLTGGILSGALSPPLFDIATPEGNFSSCSAQRVSFSRKAYEGATLIAARVSFRQVRQTSTVSFASTLVPDAAGLQSVGTVQPATPGQSNGSVIDPGITVTSNVS